MSQLQSCPECLAVWTIEEIEDQMCACCGYPNNDSEGSEPDLMGPDIHELAERQYRIQRDLK